MSVSKVLVLGVLLAFAGCSSGPPSPSAVDGGGDAGSDAGQDAGVDPDGGSAAPQVIGTSPLDGAEDVDTQAQVTATFDLALDPASVNASTFAVSGASGQVSYDDGTRTATFTPDQPYPEHATLTVRLGTGITSSEGAPLASEVTFSFTTGAVLAPAILAHSPGEGARLVPPDVTPTVTFNKPMDAASLQAAISVPGVSGSVSYNEDAHTATFHPDAPLAANASYSLEVSTAAKDTAGNALAAGGSFSFTTLPPEQVISQTTRSNHWNIKLAYGPQGDGMALWMEDPGTGSCMVGSSYSAAAGAWSPAVVVDCEVDTVTQLSLIPGPHGEFAYVDQFADGSKHLGIFSGGTWHGAPVDIGSAPNLGLAANEEGFLLGVGEATITLYPFQAGAWGAPQTFSSGIVDTGYLNGHLAIAGDGEDFLIAYVTAEKTVNARVLSGGVLGPETLVAAAPPDTASDHPHDEFVGLTRLDGGFVAYWLQVSESGQSILAAVRTDGWGSPNELLSNASFVSDMRVVASGPDALFVGHADSGANETRLYTGGAWQAAQAVGDPYATDNFGNTWATAAGGEAGFAVAWHPTASGDAYVSQLWNGGWQAPAAVASGYGTRVQLIPTAEGFEVLGWSFELGDLVELHGSGGVFSTPVAVESSSDPVTSMAGALAAGVAQAAYVQGNAVYVQRLDELSMPPVVLPSARAGAIRDVAFARDGEGIGLAVWQQFDGEWASYASLETGGSWSAPFPIASEAGRGLTVAGGETGFVVAFTDGSDVFSRTVAADGTLGDRITVDPGGLSGPAGAIALAYDGAQWLIACNSDAGGVRGIDAYVSADPTSWGSPSRLFSAGSTTLRAVSDGDGFAVGADEGHQVAVYRAGSWRPGRSFGADEGDWALTAGAAGYAVALGATPAGDDTVLATWPAGGSNWSDATLAPPLSSASAVALGPTASGFTAFGTSGEGSQQLTFEAGSWSAQAASPFGPLTDQSTYVPASSGALMLTGQLAAFLPSAAPTAQAPAPISQSSFEEGVCRANGATFDRVWIGAAPGSQEQKVRAIVGF